MKKWSIFTFLVSLLAAFLAPQLMTLTNTDSQTLPPPETRLLRYSFTLSNDTNQVLTDVRLSAFAPVKETPFQRTESIEASLPYQLQVDPWGNQQLDFLIDQLPPYASRTISVTATVSLWDRPRRNFHFPEPLNIAPLVDWNDPALAPLLPAITANPRDDANYEWIGQASTWVYTHLTDIGYVSRDLGAYYALTERKGDCTEYTYALAALAQTRGAEVFPVAGFRVSRPSSIVKAMDYHNWLMFNADRQWGMADPHGGVFDRERDDYVVFRVLGTGNEATDYSQRFFSYDERVRVLMN